MFTEDEFSFTNINSIINYVITNYHKFLLLIFVGVIIYYVDHITYINSLIYSSPSSIPGLASLKTPTPPLNHIKKSEKRSRKRRR